MNILQPFEREGYFRSSRLLGSGIPGYIISYCASAGAWWPQQLWHFASVELLPEIHLCILSLSILPSSGLKLITNVCSSFSSYSAHLLLTNQPTVCTEKYPLSGTYMYVSQPTVFRVGDISIRFLLTEDSIYTHVMLNAVSKYVMCENLTLIYFGDVLFLNSWRTG